MRVRSRNRVRLDSCNSQIDHGYHRTLSLGTALAGHWTPREGSREPVMPLEEAVASVVAADELDLPC